MNREEGWNNFARIAPAVFSLLTLGVMAVTGFITLGHPKTIWLVTIAVMALVATLLFLFQIFMNVFRSKFWAYLSVTCWFAIFCLYITQAIPLLLRQ